MKVTTRQSYGFSLIELVVVVAIVSLLSFIAAPTFKNYLIRSKVSDTITGTAGLKIMIANQISETESLTGSGSGVTAPTNLGKYVASISISSNGVINVTTTSEAGSVPYTLTPSYNTTLQQISWVCAVTNSSYNDLVPDQCRI